MLLKDFDKSKIQALAQEHGIVTLKVFGSYLKNEHTLTSDLDLLVTMKPERDLFDMIAFKLALQDSLGIAVDVVSEQGLSPFLRESILREALSFRDL